MEESTETETEWENKEKYSAAPFYLTNQTNCLSGDFRADRALKLMRNPIKILLPHMWARKAINNRRMQLSKARRCIAVSQLSIHFKDKSNWKEGTVNEGWSPCDETKMRVVTVGGAVKGESRQVRSSVPCSAQNPFSLLHLNNFRWCWLSW